MDVITQNRVLIRSVILLAVLNFLSLGILLWKGFSPPPPPPMPPGEFRDVTGILRKELGLTAEQAERLSALRTDSFEKQQTVLRLLRSQRDSMNAAMFNRATDDALVMALARRISDNEYRMELLRFEQARALKSICTPEQLAKFEHLVIEIRDYFHPDNRPPKRP